MRSLSYFKKRKLELLKEIELLNQDLQNAEHDLKENPCQEAWEAVEALEKMYAVLDSEEAGVEDAITNYEMYCYFEDQEMLARECIMEQEYVY